MSDSKVTVAVIGTGDIGRGWAALCVAAGWPVWIFDHEAQAVESASAEIAERARRLVTLDRALYRDVEEGVHSLQVGRSLLQACADAQWIIEAVPEDLIIKQKLFEAVESVAPNARIVTSSSSSLLVKDIAARCRRPDRVAIAHPLNPPELIPLVELIPGPHTDGALLEVLKGWLRALNRIPVTIRKQVPGNVAGRIAAAVWREAIDLVLTGVIDVADLDRAVSVGPALGWAAAGPHLTYHLAAGNRGVTGFLQQLLGTFENLWSGLPTWSKLEPEQQRQLVGAIERAYEGQVEQLRTARDRRLAGILRGLEQARQE
ncbi:MAG: 3-hydroxyacyl-CoA dehydrogenase family protein [Gemmatimonadetes bacterium]|nr:3-hydroxyacyl-CoA dehydrogenase family protein [Gemmatimonadota bacterium]